MSEDHALTRSSQVIVLPVIYDVYRDAKVVFRDTILPRVRRLPAVSSWSSFLDLNYLRTPDNTLEWKNRILRNTQLFRTNYAILVLLLFAYLFLLNPVPFLGALLIMAGWNHVIQTHGNPPAASKPLAREELFAFLIIATFALTAFTTIFQKTVWTCFWAMAAILTHSSLRASSPNNFGIQNFSSTSTSNGNLLSSFDTAPKHQEEHVLAPPQDEDEDKNSDIQLDQGSPDVSPRSDSSETYRKLAELRKRHISPSNSTKSPVRQLFGFRSSSKQL
mmetsp:Transcript_32447/g.52554  ORF Transcript_32447/g.52554 Transcript_32447/m.52554 type:complete len:276 (-) Transcript_32447:517-1344(-)|eukprot:CAMPEP_0184664608 /NCGR_PEP_ID=MMETSP0308-20130426/53658_1 /TAXON_ID=38269 /ORGANISM="Gloeochaete witrockiana, Strain SAG 46.84" /LENGTH=275 /DNA_ID=CAMNT_0027108125 /DNA_START=36 /DNA_END=863 /DNA_ORIENTATION=-